MIAAQYKFDHARRLFFDGDKVKSIFTRKEIRVLSRAGRFVQRKARGFIRKRKKPSKPKSSPTNQTDRYKKSILFFADLKNRSVIIGPTKLNQVTFDRDGEPVQGEVPQVLETGGEIRILEREIFPGSDGYTRMNLRTKRHHQDKKTRLRKVEIKARPHMKPAFDAEVDKFPDLFRGN